MGSYFQLDCSYNESIFAYISSFPFNRRQIRLLVMNTGCHGSLCTASCVTGGCGSKLKVSLGSIFFKRTAFPNICSRVSNIKSLNMYNIHRL